MAREDLELAARAMMAVTAPMPDSDDGFAYPVLGIDSDFDALPANQAETTVDDTITQEAVLKLAAAAIRMFRLPSDAMKDAGARVLAVNGSVTEADRRQAAAVLRAVVDEVLKA